MSNCTEPHHSHECKDCGKVITPTPEVEQSELVNAAEELLKYLDHVEKVYAGNSYAEKLRAALDKVKS